MKNKIKNKLKTFFQCYLPGFILGLISATIITVYAETYFPSLNTTYDNTNTELQSENVQDAIDELYGVCFPSAANQIIKDAELEKDSYECRYFFTGANPNNYVTFNDETAGWRIISVECDGTIKIMKNDSIESMAWDSSNSNNWARPASLNTYLNGTYYNELNELAQSQIVTKNWSIGAITYENNDLADQINDENATKWNGKVALVTVSEYLRSNSNKSSCGTFSLNNDNYRSCVNATWMYYSSGWWWTLSFDNYWDDAIYQVRTGHIYYTGPDSSYKIHPVVYLSSEVTLTGSGTQSDPYVVS